MVFFCYLLFVFTFHFYVQRSIKTEMQTANAVDYAVISCYAVLMVIAGIYVMKFNRGAAEYFRGGNRIPWLVAGLSSFMAGFSAWTFTGAAGVAYRAGIAV